MNLNQQIDRWLISLKKSIESEKRPFVTLAYAQSIDGSITAKRGEVMAISGKDSICLTHQLRSLHDGILVGIETVLTDDPQLTVREWDGSNPQPIVLDSLLRVPSTARICHHPDKQCWILTIQTDFDNFGDQVRIITIEKDVDDRIHLVSAMKLLRENGITSLMVEGGATVITAFLKARLVDAVVVTISPMIVGGYKAVSNLETSNLNLLPHINPLFSENLGDDLIIWGGLQYGISGH